MDFHNFQDFLTRSAYRTRSTLVVCNYAGGAPPLSNFWEDPHLSQSETPEMRAQMELLPEETLRGVSNLGNFEKSQNSNRGGGLPHYVQPTRVVIIRLNIWFGGDWTLPKRTAGKTNSHLTILT